MENYSYTYPDSGHSSPRSRELDFENPPPSWEDQQPPPPLPPNHKVKFLVSYGGKIQPHTHDNQLSYVGGDTKILSVDRSISFSSLLSKLSSLLTTNNTIPSPLTSFKYQLPEDQHLDSLISVTNDDDLEHLMLEYDRLYRASPKPARLRLFIFPGPQSRFGSTSSDPGFVHDPPLPSHQPPPIVSGVGSGDMLFDSDRFVHEFNKVQIHEPPPRQQPGYHNPLPGEKPPPTIPASIPATIPASYWQPPPEQHHQPSQPPTPPPPSQHQQVYMVHAPPPQPASGYHAPVNQQYQTPVGRPVAGQPPQGYYQIQRVPSDAAYVAQSQPLVGKMAGYTEGMGLPVRPVAGMVENSGNSSGGYQVAYDSATGRQVYYPAPGMGVNVGVVTTPFQGVGGGVSGGFNSGEGKVFNKVSSTSSGM